MQQRGFVPDVDDARGVAPPAQMLRQLLRAMFVGAGRDADQKMSLRLADVSAVDGARCLDGLPLRAAIAQALRDALHLAPAAGCSGACEYGAAFGDDRRVLDEGCVGMGLIGLQLDDVETAFAQRLDVARVLLQR